MQASWNILKEIYHEVLPKETYPDNDSAPTLRKIFDDIEEHFEGPGKKFD